MDNETDLLPEVIEVDENGVEAFFTPAPDFPEGDALIPIETAGDEIVFGTDQPETIFITGSDSLVFAGDGDDKILATDTSLGDNIIYGGGGNDDFTLGANDRYYGGEGGDRFFAQTGGGNFVTGGGGPDEFWIAVGGRPQPFPPNIITDFNPDEDVIGIAGLEGVTSFEDLEITTFGSGDATSSIVSLATTDPDGSHPPLAVFLGIEIADGGSFVFA